MNRTLLLTSAATLPLLADASLKSAALLALAAVCALAMRRASAAARHVVWLAAVLALLLVPVLSLVLPGWRVLPEWTAVEPATGRNGMNRNEASFVPPAVTQSAIPSPMPPDAPAPSPHSFSGPNPSPPAPALVAAAPPPAPPVSATAWLLPAWAAGCALLLLRLTAAHWLLRRATRRSAPATGPLAAAISAAVKESGLRQPVRLLLDEQRTIPVVWGIFRPTLLLPEESLTWDAAQLRSVLMHELAHLRRRDPLVQALTQIACALHWFNPLVWLAAWRLHVERERACDDLVLASGVKASTYASHLLHVATQLSPARGTAACGLAMARKSSLEGRLLAVLSDRLNRRSLTRALTAAAILLGAAVAIPVAMLRAQEQKPDVGTATATTNATPRTEDAKLNPAALAGVWEGEKDGVQVKVNFEWLSEHQQVRWSVQRDGSNITAQMSVVMESDGKAAKFVFRKGLEFEATQGRVQPGPNGTLRLEVIPNPNLKDPGYPAVKDLALTLKANVEALLDPNTEAQLDWGEAVSGLRAAVVIRSPQSGAAPGIYLAVQNVSAAALRFSDTIAARELRKFYVSAPAGRILFVLTSGEPTNTDVVLQPREVVYLAVMPPDKAGDAQSHSAALIEGLRKDSRQTWKVVMEITTAPEGAWKGTLTTAETRGAVTPDGPQPKDKHAQALFKTWQTSARLNGDIPGGRLSRLHDKVKEFIHNNSGDSSGDPYAKKLAPLEPRLDVAGDWKPAAVVAMLDDIAAVTSIPLETTLEHLTRNTLHPGQTNLPRMLASDWGEPLPCGLRMAYVLEPRGSGEYHLGTELKARILLQNTGEEPVAFVTSGFQQPGHKARLAGGKELQLDSTSWTTRGRTEAYRLAPGEYCEVYTPGLGIGAHDKDRDDWSSVRAGSWILCSPGDEVVFSPGAALLSRRDEQPDKDDWWLEFITERLSREAPVPLDTKEREYLLYRVMTDLFGTAPSTTEGDAFAADKSPDALKNLAVLLTKHAYGKQCQGTIRGSDTTFRVLPPDPDAKKKPRVATGPGRYTLGDLLRFEVTSRPAGESIVNEASITYFPQGKDNISHEVKLPDDYNTWAAAWEPGTTIMWVQGKDVVTCYNFADPAKITEISYTKSDVRRDLPPMVWHRSGMTDPVLVALRAALPGQQKVEQTPQNPAPAAPTSPARKEEPTK